LVDNDPAHYTVALLAEWRSTAERGARLALEAGSAWSTSTDPVGERNRNRMLGRVKNFWIQGVLEDSVHNNSLPLDKVDSPGSVVPPLREFISGCPPHTQATPSHIPIYDVFESANRALLILGDPGSGKTILLLELARACVARAELNQAAPIPVVLNLSSWAYRQLRLDLWIIQELNLKYQVPNSVSRSWLGNAELLLLLDGLDEVREDKREDCIEAINEFRGRFGLTDIAVCSRASEYSSLSTKLALDAAIHIQPLTMEQVDSYLAALGPAVGGLRTLITARRQLQELATTPLMLSVMITALSGDDLASLSAPPGTQGAKELTSTIFSLYVRHVLFAHRRGISKLAFSPLKTLMTLKWLAVGMSAHKESEFFVESLQPSWVRGRFDSFVYGAAVRLFGILAFILGVLLSDILHLHYLGHDPMKFAIRQGFVFGAAFAVAFLLGGVRPSLRAPRWLSVIIATATAAGVIASGSAVPISTNWPWALYPLPSALAGVSLGDVRSIRIVETLSWSSTRLMHIVRSLILPIYVSALAVFGLSALVQRIVGSRAGSGSVSGVAIKAPIHFGNILLGILAAIITLAAVAAVSGLTSEEVGQLRTVPNQGLRRSGRNAVIVFAAVFFLAAAAMLANGNWDRQSYLGALEVGTACGLIAAFSLGGGTPCVQHLILRSMLIARGDIPRSFVSFLNHCSQNMFLRKVGGGYLFIHRTLLQFLVEADSTLLMSLAEPRKSIGRRMNAG